MQFLLDSPSKPPHTPPHPTEIPASPRAAAAKQRRKPSWLKFCNGLGLSRLVFAAAFQSSAGTMWCQLKVTKTLALPYAAAVLENHTLSVWERVYWGDATERANCPYVSEGALFIILSESCPLEPQTFLIKTKRKKKSFSTLFFIVWFLLF